jgi:hypothetical protein
MMRSQFVLYMNQPSILVTLGIMHEWQSKGGREAKEDGSEVCMKCRVERRNNPTETVPWVDPSTVQRDPIGVRTRS